MNIVCDIDSTLVQWNYLDDGGGYDVADVGIPPFGWDWNYPLIARLINAHFDGHHLTLWSGGGTQYAQMWRARLAVFLGGLDIFNESMGKAPLMPILTPTLFVDDDDIRGWLHKSQNMEHVNVVLPCSELVP